MVSSQTLSADSSRALPVMRGEAALEEMLMDVYMILIKNS